MAETRSEDGPVGLYVRTQGDARHADLGIGASGASLESPCVRTEKPVQGKAIKHYCWRRMIQGERLRIPLRGPSQQTFPSEPSLADRAGGL